MAQIFSRMYATTAAAEAAVAELRAYGLPADYMVVTAPGHSPEATIAAIMKGHVERKLAAIYAEGVANGGTLLSVAAPLGHGYNVIQILDEAGPIDSGYTPPAGEPAGFDNAAPFSDMLGLPVLTAGGKAGTVGLPLISHGFTIPIPQLTKSGPTIPIGALPNSPTIPIPQIADSKGGYKPIIPLPLLSASRRA